MHGVVLVKYKRHKLLVLKTKPLLPLQSQQMDRVDFVTEYLICACCAATPDVTVEWLLLLLLISEVLGSGLDPMAGYPSLYIFLCFPQLLPANSKTVLENKQ